MVSEKIDAMFEAGANLMAGATPLRSIDRYREHVAANAKRLSAYFEHDPRRRVVAGAFLAAHLAVDAGLDQARRERRAQQEMIEPQAGIARPAVSLVIPEREHRLCRDAASRIASHQPCATSDLNAARLFGWISASLSHDLVG